MWVDSFEARRLAAMTTLFNAALSEYQREVTASTSRMHFFLWLCVTRWTLVGLQLVLATTQLGPYQRLGFATQAVFGLILEIGGALIILRGAAYYRAARDHLVLCAEQLQPGDWSPASTRRAKSRIWQIRTVVIALLVDLALGDIGLFVWAMTG